MSAGSTTANHATRIGSGTEVAHVGVERLTAGERQEHRAECDEGEPRRGGGERRGVARVERAHDVGRLEDACDAERPDE